MSQPSGSLCPCARLAFRGPWEPCQAAPLCGLEHQGAVGKLKPVGAAARSVGLQSVKRVCAAARGRGGPSQAGRKKPPVSCVVLVQELACDVVTVLSRDLQSKGRSSRVFCQKTCIVLLNEGLPVPLWEVLWAPVCFRHGRNR